MSRVSALSREGADVITRVDPRLATPEQQQQLDYLTQLVTVKRQFVQAQEKCVLALSAIYFFFKIRCISLAKFITGLVTANIHRDSDKKKL